MTMFNNQAHKENFILLCPGKLMQDAEWYAPIYVLTSDSELRAKTIRYVDTLRREIHWQKIFDTDFGSGHRAALYWAFSLWAGNSWPTDEGRIDTMSEAFYMDEDLRRTAIYALLLRWRMRKVEA